MVPPCTDAELSNQSIREKAIVVEADAIGVLKARSFKIALCWSAADTEYRRLENGWTLVAESRAQAIFIGNVGVHLTINKICIFVEGQQSKVVIGVAGTSCGRQKSHKFGGDGINQGQRDDVRATACLAGRIVCIPLVRYSIRTLNRTHARSGSSKQLRAASSIRGADERVVDWRRRRA